MIFEILDFSHFLFFDSKISVMGVPKSKPGRMRARRRRAFLTVSVPSFSTCPNCGAYKLPHRICPECGYYKGVKFVRSAEERRAEIRAKQEERKKEASKG